MSKKKLTIERLISAADNFCKLESKFENKDLFGITDGKAVGTYIEHKFKRFIDENYVVEVGNSAHGIDLSSPEINTDIKVTSIKQPQSSSPFKNPKQKIYGLGYNLLVFVYEKKDSYDTESSFLNFKSCSFIRKDRTADYTTTFRLIQMLRDGANKEDIIAYLSDRNIPADEITLNEIATEILENPPKLGYLTISNALQWRLQYGRVVGLSEIVDGIVKIVDSVNNK